MYIRFVKLFGMVLLLLFPMRRVLDARQALAMWLFHIIVIGFACVHARRAPSYGVFNDAQP